MPPDEQQHTAAAGEGEPGARRRRQQGLEPANQISFVNGIWTARGGEHVRALTRCVVNELRPAAQRVVDAEMAQKAKGAGEVAVRPADVRRQLAVYVNALVPNPAFDSQTKEARALCVCVLDVRLTEKTHVAGGSSSSLRRLLNLTRHCLERSFGR